MQLSKTSKISYGRELGIHLQYSTRFDDVEDRDMSSPMQGVSTSTASGLLGGNNLDTSLPETFRAPPRPLPYDTDPRYLRALRDGLISRRDKSGMSHLHTGETEPLRRISLHGPDGGGGEALTPLQRRNGGNGGGSDHNEELGQGYKPDSPGKRLPSSKGFARVESTMSLAEDEDMCPTCLDGHFLNSFISSSSVFVFHHLVKQDSQQVCPIEVTVQNASGSGTLHLLKLFQLLLAKVVLQCVFPWRAFSELSWRHCKQMF